MENSKIVISAITLWIYGMGIHIYKSFLSMFIKKNAPLSKKHTVLAFMIYERSLTLWHQKEKKHIMLLRKKLSREQSLPKL